MMNILFVVPYVPNLIRSRSYNIIRKLVEHGNQVHLITLWSNDEERRDAEELKQYCGSVQAFSMPAWRSLVNSLIALPTSQPLQAWYSWNPQMARQIIATIQKEKIDVVHVEHLRGSKYALSLRSWWPGDGGSGKPCPPIVWDSVDCISYLFRQSSVQSRRQAYRWITQLELKRTEKFEADLTKQFPVILVTSQKDQNALLSLKGATTKAAKLRVFPIGVDLDYFRPDPQQKRESSTLLVSGKMSYHANVSMVIHLFEQIMPRIWSKHPEVKLWIVGKDPTQEIKDMAAHPNVKVTGMVPDLRPYMQRATVAVAPLTYGAGMQFKVIESMACATPVVATPLAVSALTGVVHDQDVLVAQEPDDFADQAIRLLDNAHLRQAVGESGRRYVERHFSWDRLVTQLEEVYHGVIEINGTALQG
jgi:sugar transferase (PEP-CTERM/EpsH1 system associated)